MSIIELDSTMTCDMILGMNCITCHQDKPEAEFNWKNRRKRLLHPRCKICQRRYSKQHYQLHKPDYLRRNRLRRDSTRAKLNQLKNKTACADCHRKYPSYVMDYHHLYDKKFSIQAQHTWSTVQKEIKKCVLLCANCHRIRTHGVHSTSVSAPACHAG